MTSPDYSAWINDINSLSAVPPAMPGAERRGFMLGTLGAGFAASVAPTGALLAQTIQTDGQGLELADIFVKVADGQVPAFVAKPAGKRHCPTILVVQEIFGVHEYIRDVCRRFAKLGYMAVAPEMFFRQGDPRQYTNAADIISNIMSKVPDATVLSDLDACAAWAAGNGGSMDKLGITGFCWGGRIVWMYSAHQPRLKAGVAWYGRLNGAQNAITPNNPLQIADKLKAPVLGLYGAADTGIPLDTVEDMKDRLSVGDQASQASSFVVYPDTPHAFHADYRPSYRAPAAADGWTRALAWFRKNGVM